LNAAMAGSNEMNFRSPFVTSGASGVLPLRKVVQRIGVQVDDTVLEIAENA
jgi:hypothetical protein